MGSWGAGGEGVTRDTPHLPPEKKKTKHKTTTKTLKKMLNQKNQRGKHKHKVSNFSACE